MWLSLLTVGPEQSFKQLLPEFSSPESQHADLPSIYSIEARDASQGMENHDYSEQTEILQKKKNVHFQSSAENLSPVCSSPNGATVFNQLHLLQGSPSSSTSMLGFEELSRKIVAVPQSQRLTQDKKEAINPHVENSEGSHSLSVQNEMSIQNRIKTETKNPSQLSQAEHIMNSFPSSIPVWVSMFCKIIFLWNLSSRTKNSNTLFIVNRRSYFMLGRQRWAGAGQPKWKKKAGPVL